MASKTSKKANIKINKKHGGKEFSNSFRFIGQVKPVRKKEEGTESWVDVPFFQQTTTKTDKPRRVLQFNIETANKNELKVELAGMEKDVVYAYSKKNDNTVTLNWNDRHDKSKLPDDTYHIMKQEWDQTEEIAKWLQAGMWVDVRGKYEFEVFTNDEGKEVKSVKRIIQNVFPLKNGEVQVKGLKENDEIRVYATENDDILLGYGKANKEGVAVIKVGWLNPSGGSLFICKVDGEKEGKRTEQKYNESVVETDRIIVRNNVPSEIYIENEEGKREKITYIRDFNDPEFKEINNFEMQIAIKSTYQDEKTKDTKVNAVFLTYGKDRSIPKDVELTVYYKEASEGKTPLADAFARLNRLDFMVVTGIDNNRAEFAWVEVEDTDDDNPFADVDEKTTQKELVTAGTRKGLEILSYVTGTYSKASKGLISEEDITLIEEDDDNPFGGTSLSIEEDDLPF